MSKYVASDLQFGEGSQHPWWAQSSNSSENMAITSTETKLRWDSVEGEEQ